MTILCLDFDGVLHSYTSGWQGIDIIPDPPVAGAMVHLRSYADSFEVHIFSARSRSSGGREAMQNWVRHALVQSFGHEVSAYVMQRIVFANYKPSAFVTLDDRAITFTGKWPTTEELWEFKQWQK